MLDVKWIVVIVVGDNGWKKISLVISQLLLNSSVEVDVDLLQSTANPILDVSTSLCPNLASIWRALAGLVGGISGPGQRELHWDGVVKAVDDLHSALNTAKGGVKNGMAKKVGETGAGEKVDTEDSEFIAEIDSLLMEANNFNWEVGHVVGEVVGTVDLGGRLLKLLVDELVGDEKSLVLVWNRELVVLDGGSFGCSRDGDNGAAVTLLAQDGVIGLVAELPWEVNKGGHGRGGGAHGEGVGYCVVDEDDSKVEVVAAMVLL